MAEIENFDTALRQRQRAPSLKRLSQELVLLRSEDPSPFMAPALAYIYPLALMRSWTLVTGFHRWMELAGPDGVYVEGVHGNSDELPRTEPDLFPDHSLMIEVKPGMPPATWRFVFIGQGFVETQRKKFLGDTVGSYPSREVRLVISQNYLELIARRQPAVARIDGPTLRGWNCYDRLWLPICLPDGSVSRFVTVTEPIVRLLD